MWPPQVEVWISACIVLLILLLLSDCCVRTPGWPAVRCKVRHVEQSWVVPDIPAGAIRDPPPISCPQAWQQTQLRPELLSPNDQHTHSQEKQMLILLSHWVWMGCYIPLLQRTDRRWYCQLDFWLLWGSSTSLNHSFWLFDGQSWWVETLNHLNLIPWKYSPLLNCTQVLVWGQLV